MATNPNPFLRSPLDRAADDMNREAERLRAAIPQPEMEELALPEPVAEPVAQAPAAPVKPARKKTGTAQDLMPPDDMIDMFKATAEHYEVPVNVLMALAQQESGYNAGAVGVETKWGKAKGAMQYLDSTAKGLGIDAMDPNQAIPAAAFQIRQRLDKGMSMEDAVMEHFAGPDRAQWGEKTAAYGREVMAKVGEIGKFLIGPSAQFAAVPTPPKPGSKNANRMSTTMNRDDYLNTVVANNPQATAPEIKMLMDQFDADNAKRGSPVEAKFATMQDPNATFDAKLDAKLAARQKNKGVVPAMPSVAPEQQAGPTDDPSLTNDVQRGLRNLQAMAYGVAGLGADAMGMDAKAEKLLGEYVDITEANLRDNPAAIGTYKNVKDMGDAGRYAVEAVLENAAMIIPSLLTGGIGAAAAKKAAEKVVGGMVQKQVAQGIGRKVAEQNALKFIAKRVTIGATVGAAASSVGMEAGSVMGDIYAETGQAEAGTAAVAGVAAGLLDTIGPVMALRKVMGPVVDEAAGHVLKRFGAEVGKQFLAEAGTEGLQTLIEKAAVRSVDGKELFNAQLADELIDATLKGGIGGAVMGGASSAVEAARAPAQVAPLPSDAAPLPVTDSPLAQAMSEASSPAARAVVVDQAGQQVAATVTNASPNADVFEVVDDDGNVRVITDMDGLQILPVESETGPLSSALAGVAAAEPVEVESTQLPATGAEPTLAPTMENADAVSPIAQDGTAGAAAIAPAEPGAAVAAPESGADVAVPAMADAAAPDALTVPATTGTPDWKANPYSAYQFADAETAARFMDKKQVNADQFEAVQTGKVRWQIVPKTAAQPATQGATDERRSADGQPGNRDDSVRVLDVGRGRDRGDGGAGSADGIGGSDAAAVRDQRRAGAGGNGAAGTGGTAVGGDTAKPKQALKIPKEGFGTAELAKAFRKKAKLDASHEVVQTGRVRWEVRAKGEAAPNSNWREKEDAKEVRLSSALATANANAARRNMTDKKIDKDWSAFSMKSGTLNIDRAEMPQVKAEHRGALVNFLNARGIEHAQEEVAADSLKPTQREFSPAKIEKAKAFEGGDRSILVSSDNHVLDGHHQWMAKMEQGEPVKVIRLDAPISQLLADVKEFPSVEESGGATEKKDGPGALVDADGKPLVVYHGSNTKMPAKLRAGEPIYVTTNQGYADSFKSPDQGETAAFRAKINNPYYATEKGEIDGIKYDKGAIAKLRALGHDGAIFKGKGAPQQALVFDASQLERVGEPQAITKEKPAAKPKAKKQAEEVKFSTGKTSTVKELEAAIASKYDGLKLDLLDRGNDIELSRVIVPKDARNSGTGTAIMNELIAYADATGKRIILTPSSDFGGSRVRLREFYKRFGFVDNKGKNKDFSTMAGMYREPKAKFSTGTKPGTLTPESDAEFKARVLDVAYSKAYGSNKMIDRFEGDGMLVAKMRKTGQPIFVFNGRFGRDQYKQALTEALAAGLETKRIHVYADSITYTGDGINAIRLDSLVGFGASSRNSVAAGRSGSLDTESLRKSIATGTLGPVVDSMVESGLIVLHADASTLPTKKAPKSVQALTTPDGKVHLVASNLNGRNARAVMLHEAFHQGGEKLIGTEQWNVLMRRMKSLMAQGKEASKGGKANVFYEKARARVASAKDQGAVEPQFEAEEFAAYAIEEYESSPTTVKKWVDDLLGMVKAWMLKRFGAQFGDVTPAQLSAIAKLAIMDVAAAKRGEMFGPAGDMLSVGNRTIEVDGVRRPIENSKGQLVAPDFNKQVAFWKWFGDSKVVDGSGYPLVVYHGTNADFKMFDTSARIDKMGRPTQGAYFTADHENASSYGAANGDKTGRNVMPVYLSIQNPYVIEDSSGAQYAKMTSISAERVDELRAQGHDGIIYNDRTEGTGPEGEKQEIVVFDHGQIKSAVGANGRFDPANPDIRYSVAEADAPAGEDAQANTGLTPPEQKLLRRIQATIQDQMNRVKQVQERIEKVLGQPLPENADYYLAETNRPGRIAARLEDGENDLFTPLMERLAKAGNTPEQLEELLHAMHAAERNDTVARMNPKYNPESDQYEGTQGSGMADEDAARTIKKYEGAEFAALHKLADDARAIARHTLDLKLAYGLLTPERHEQLTTHYEFYVPLKGDGEYGVKVKQAMGHDARDEYIVENLLRDFKQAVVAGEKNMARQVLLRMILKNPDEKLWSVGIPPKGRYIAGKVYEVFKGKVKVASFDSPSAVAAFMEGKRGEAVQYTVKDSAGMQVAEFTKQLQDNEVMVYLDGQAVRVQIYDEALAKQLRPLDRGQMNWFWQQSQKLNRYYSKIYTGYNPAFILRNAARDAMTGTINMMGRYGSTTAAKAWGRYPQALAALGYWATTGKIPKTATGDMLRAYRDQGGKVGASHMGDLEAQGVALQRIYEDAKGAFSYAAEGKVPKAAWIASRKAISKLARVVEIANQATENALRLALFMELRAQGETPAKSAQAAKTVTVDFDRKGASTAALSAAYLFFNPAIQGSANGIMTLAKGKHRKQAWAAMGGLAVLGYWLASKGMDEDKDRWLGEKWDIRTKNLIINGKEHQIRVPMSQEFAPFFAFGHALAEVSRGEKKSTVAIRMVSAFLDAYVPLRGAYDPDSDNNGADLLLALVPSVGQMPAQLAMNRNSFGSQIVPESAFTSDRPDNLKMNRATKNSTYDKAAQKIADAGVAAGYAGRYENDITKVSPETLKLLWSNFTGGLGTFIADSVGVAAMGADPSIDVTRGEVPIVKDFVRTQTVKPLRSRYFELSREARTAIDEFKQAKKAGDGEAMDQVLADEGKAAALGIAKLIKADSEAAKALREEAVDVNADPSLTPGQKRARLKELEQEEEALYREAIKAFE